MSERWQQWMPFHIDRWRGSPSVQAMHPAAQMGYLNLLCSSWQSSDCSLSSDPVDLATESRLGDELWALYGPRILRKFVLQADRWQNSVLFEAWEEARRIYEKRKSGAVRTNTSRSAPAVRTHTERRADTQTLTGTVTETEAKTTTPLTRRGCRIPPDFSVTEEHRRLAEEKHYICPDEIIEEFRDYWIGVPGSRGVKLDWDATFRNRMREKTKPNGGTNGTRPQYENQYDRARRRIREEAEREERASYPS